MLRSFLASPSLFEIPNTVMPFATRFPVCWKYQDRVTMLHLCLQCQHSHDSEYCRERSSGCIKNMRVRYQQHTWQMRQMRAEAIGTYHRWFWAPQEPSLPTLLGVTNGKCKIAPDSQVSYGVSTPPNGGGPPLQPAPNQSCLQLVQHWSIR